MADNKINIPYFAEKEEQAVIDYINSDIQTIKNRIYNEILIEPFRKMIESILRRYPIHIGNYTMDEVESDALKHLIEHMVKYKPYIIEHKTIVNDCDEKWIKLGNDYRFMNIENAIDMLNSLDINNKKNEYRIFYSRAFSYCQTIIRNYYKDHSKKSYNEVKINLSYDDFVDEIEKNDNYIYEIDFTEHQQLEQLINTVMEKIEYRINNDVNIKKNEIIVGDAIINILKNWHVLFIEDSADGKYRKRITNKFAKNKILLFLNEQTGLSTKEIRIAIKPFKEIYFFEKTGYFDD